MRLMGVLSGSSHEISAYMRVASLAIAFYDYLQTLPFEYRMWRSAWKGRQLTVFDRYTSILVLVVSNFGFFYEGFTEESCQRYFLTPSVFKVVQIMVSQVILVIILVFDAYASSRAYNLSRKSTKFAYALIFLFVLASSRKLVFLRHGSRSLSKMVSSCSSSSPTSLWGGWAHYAVAIVYDFIITVICIFFLLKLKTSKGSMMLVDGICYFIGLALINFLNLGLYRASSLEVQVRHLSVHTLASLGYCVTWIMSQRLLIHIHEASVERRNGSIDAAVTITQRIVSARDVSRAIRSQFESKNGAAFDLTVPDFDVESLPRAGPSCEEDRDTEVHVRIERTVTMERVPRVYELEDYSRTGRSTVTSRSKH
ncbi:hypothetical protein B0H12DRAFT_1144766 [Mycena haematopus]|nr:hypothetical protein B0H12DRAFT_1144766 [Mycena haematopus]